MREILFKAKSVEDGKEETFSIILDYQQVMNIFQINTIGE